MRGEGGLLEALGKVAVFDLVLGSEALNACRLAERRGAVAGADFAVGELGLCGVGAAIANAIYNATGVRVREYPITLDKIIGGMAKVA